MAIGASTTPYDQGCSLERALEEDAGVESIAPSQQPSREPDRVPIVVNPGPVAPPLPVTATAPREPPIVVNPGPVPPPDDQD